MKNLSNLTDKELILEYKSGNLEALNLLVKRWHLQFCKFALWIVKDADVAKDITQESWQIIFKKLKDLKEPEKFKPWAISIVNRKAIDFLRAKQRVVKNKDNYAKEVKLNTNQNDEDSTIIKEKLLKAINSLSIQHQHIIKLFYTQNYSLKEISELLYISVGTVKSRLFHAREKLKSILKK